MERENLPANTAQVHLLSALPHIDRAYDYFLPASLRQTVRRGDFVLVPFGGGNRKQVAIVTDLTTSDPERLPRLKPVLASVDPDESLNALFLKLVFFLKEQTFCTVGEAVRAILPAAAFSKINELFTAQERPSSDALASLKPKQLRIFRFVEEGKSVSLDAVRAAFGSDAGRILQELCRAGLILPVVECHPFKKCTRTVWFLAGSPDETEAFLSQSKRSPKQAAVLRTLLNMNGLEEGELVRATGGKALTAPLAALEKRGWIRREVTDAYRNPYAIPPAAAERPTLSEEQKAATDTLCGLYDTHAPRAALLHGVTGSGKTQVIRAVMDHVIADGRQVILLVPEIALTPQTVAIFASYYGERIAVLHSALSAGERFDAWRRIKEGLVDVCIGTRSAVFAPFPRLGMIVLDEEQEHTYQSDRAPHYHARDVARFRCANESALMLLASATPSLESYFKAQTGVYTLISLKNRFGGAKLPPTRILDLRGEGQRAADASPFGDALCAALQETTAEKKQAILFVNRRGYHNYLACTACGGAITCPHCSVSLTYHRPRGQQGGRLTCHCCGYGQSVPSLCPSCGKDRLAFMGFGTQRAEECLAAALPDARILRMDADTTANKFSYDAMLEQFRNGSSDILLGTQMVTKGHDFPNVTLVGVLLADLSLFVDDFRAAERTFALLTQVIGRAGRAHAPGVALIQTYNPDHPLLQMAARQDYEGFYQNEIEMRRALTFPPFCDLCLLLLTASLETEVQNAAKEFSRRLREALSEDYRDVTMLVFGPMEAPVYKVNDKYRMQFVLKCKNNARTRQLLHALQQEFGEKISHKVTIGIRMNPSEL